MRCIGKNPLIDQAEGYGLFALASNHQAPVLWAPVLCAPIFNARFT
jgi:hypothetical protein